MLLTSVYPSVGWISSTAEKKAKQGSVHVHTKSAVKSCVYMLIVKAEAYFEEGKVDLFRVSILLFVHTRVEILHIQDNTQKSVHFLL